MAQEGIMHKKLSDHPEGRIPLSELAPPKSKKSVTAYAMEMQGPRPNMKPLPTPLPFDAMLAMRMVFQIAMAGRGKDTEGNLVTIPANMMIAVLPAEMRKVDCEYESIQISVKSNLAKEGYLDMLPGRRFLVLPAEVTPDTVYDYLMKCIMAKPDGKK
jgi:hypothetical protein